MIGKQKSTFRFKKTSIGILGNVTSELLSLLSNAEDILVIIAYSYATEPSFLHRADSTPNKNCFKADHYLCGWVAQTGTSVKCSLIQILLLIIHMCLSKQSNL